MRQMATPSRLHRVLKKPAFWAAVLLLVVGAAHYPGAQQRAQLMERIEQTDARLESFRITEHWQDDGGYREIPGQLETYLRLETRFSYQVNGQPYHADLFSMVHGNNIPKDSDLGRQALALHQDLGGKPQVKIWFDPLFPGHAFLVNDHNGFFDQLKVWMPLFTGALVIGLCLIRP